MNDLFLFLACLLDVKLEPQIWHWLLHLCKIRNEIISLPEFVGFSKIDFRCKSDSFLLFFKIKLAFKIFNLKYSLYCVNSLWHILLSNKRYKGIPYTWEPWNTYTVSGGMLPFILQCGHLPEWAVSLLHSYFHIISCLPHLLFIGANGRLHQFWTTLVSK